MSNKKYLGLLGENIAINYLLNCGYKILVRNKRLGRLEIDIIARRDDWTVFIEVKSCSDWQYNDNNPLHKEQGARLARAMTLFSYREKVDFEHTRLDLIIVRLQNLTRRAYLVHYQDLLGNL